MKCDSTKEEIFDSIYRSYVDDIYRVCLYFVKDAYLAQDITQQTFLNFYEHFENVKPEFMRAYLIRTAKNMIYNHQRDLKYETGKDDDVLQALQEELMTESLEEQYFREKQETMERELSGDILTGLHEKKQSWYEIFMMRYFSDKTSGEISNELGITEETLYSRIYRAKRWIRKHYEKEFSEISDLV